VQGYTEGKRGEGVDGEEPFLGRACTEVKPEVRVAQEPRNIIRCLGKVQLQRKGGGGRRPSGITKKWGHTKSEFGLIAVNTKEGAGGEGVGHSNKNKKNKRAGDT